MSDKPEKIYINGVMREFPEGLKYYHASDERILLNENIEYIRADLAKPSEEVKRLEDRIVEVEAENFNLMVDSLDFVPTNTHLELVRKYKELEQAKPSEWISVEDRLPEESFLNWVLVGRDESSGCPSVVQAMFRDGDFMVISGLRGNFSVFANPTHWQPLPPPPEPTP